MTTIPTTTVLCGSCGTGIERDLAVPGTPARYYCRACAEGYRDCEYCSLYGPDVDIADNGIHVCSSCADDRNYHSCATCDVLVHHSTLCSTHDVFSVGSADGIHEYGYKPTPVFHGDGPCYLGMELEITVPDNDLDERVDDANTALEDLGYLKEDASISCGFELVTHPMSYAWALDSFPWSLLEYLERHGCSGDDNGLHVHISRDAFTGPCHIYRWMKFIHRNAPAVQTLARRVEETFAAFTPTEREHVKHTCKGRPDDRRNVAINTQNRTTFELRVFAGSLQPRRVQAALAFAEASVHYTHTLTTPEIVHRRGWDWSAFTAWLHTHPQYAPLTSELEGLACAC